ncbi:MAG: MFS transporter [Phototrophicaceae bacterium]
MKLPKSRLFWAVSLSHFTNDLFMSMGPVLLTFISGVYMPITSSQIGLAQSLREFVGALGQPVIGWIGDRGGARWIGTLGLAWTVSGTLLATYFATLSNYPLMVTFFALSAIGSAAIHPIGVSFATYKETEHSNRNMSFFFLMGQLGLALGPAIAGVLLGMTQTDGQLGNLNPIFWLGLIAIPAVLFKGMTLPNISLSSKNPDETATPITNKVTNTRSIMIFMALVLGRGLCYMGTVTFIPLMFHEKGWSPNAYGSITGIYWLASAFSGVVLGYMADYVDRRRIITIVMILVAPIYWLLASSNGAMAFVYVLLAGMLGQGLHSVMIVMGQRLLPGGKGFVSGLTLGMMFGAGAIGTFINGYLVEGFSVLGWTMAGIGIVNLFRLVGMVGAVMGLLALLLPPFDVPTSEATVAPLAVQRNG